MSDVHDALLLRPHAGQVRRRRHHLPRLQWIPCWRFALCRGEESGLCIEKPEFQSLDEENFL